MVVSTLDSSLKSTGPVAWMWLGLLGPCLALPVLAMVVLGLFWVPSVFFFLFLEALSVPVLPGLTRRVCWSRVYLKRGFVVPGSTCETCLFSFQGLLGSVVPGSTWVKNPISPSRPWNNRPPRGLMLQGLLGAVGPSRPWSNRPPISFYMLVACFSLHFASIWQAFC